jgi:hypothetical protein
MNSPALLLTVLACSFILCLRTLAASLPDDAQVRKIQNLCGAEIHLAKTESADVELVMATWRRASSGGYLEVAKSNLKAALATLQANATLSLPQKSYIGCVADLVTQYMTDYPETVSKIVIDEVLAVKPILEGNGVIFFVETRVNYSGSHGSNAGLNVCAAQGAVTVCDFAKKSLSNGENEAVRLRMPIQEKGFMGDPLDTKRDIDFGVCMSYFIKGEPRQDFAMRKPILDPPDEAVIFGCRLHIWKP